MTKNAIDFYNVPYCSWYSIEYNQQLCDATRMYLTCFVFFKLTQEDADVEEWGYHTGTRDLWQWLPG